jgi:high-affinity iron transporter
MLTTFVIGLREGLEAALIVGIVGAFLIQNGERQALKAMWLGVGLAIALCISLALALDLAGQRLPLRARGSLEGVLTLSAVVGVTYMLVWMRRHSRFLKSDLEAKTAEALDKKSTKALVGLAFVAVIREGLETAIFLFAVLEGSANVAVGLVGATAGIVVASGLGYAIYKGGARINLSRFFRVTGVVLVLVAAGLVASSIHEFAEAGVFGWGQSPAVDLSGIIAPGTVRAGLLTAFLGFQPVPTYAELLGWLLFLVPAAWYVLRPQRRPASQLAT